MKVIALVQQKGGVGKTTLALNLSVAAEERGEKVLVVDLDAQGSAVFWSASRGTNKPTVVDALPEKLAAIISAAGELGATMIVIDAPSRLDEVALHAVRAADLVICPCPADLMNLHPLRQTVDLIEAAGKRDAALVVLNDLDKSGAAKKIEQAREVLKMLKLAMANTIVSHLPAFSAAYDKGKAVTELRPGDGKAATQIRELWSEIDKHARRIAAPRRNGKAKEARA